MQLQRNGLSLAISSMLFLVGTVCWVLLLSVPTLNYGGDKGLPLWFIASISGMTGSAVAIAGIIRRGHAVFVALLVMNLLLMVSPFLMWTIGTLIWGP